MAKHSYKITFKDRVVTYTTQEHVHSVPYRVLDKQQMKLMNLMLHDVTEPHFGCTDEEFYARLTSEMLRHYKELKKNEFKLIVND